MQMKENPFYCEEQQKGCEPASPTTQRIQIHAEITRQDSIHSDQFKAQLFGNKPAKHKSGLDCRGFFVFFLTV